INAVSRSTNGASSIDQLVRQIMTTADTNSDGQLSSAEFGAFLTKLIEKVSPGTLSSASSGVVSLSAPPLDGSPINPTPPTVVVPPAAAPSAPKFGYVAMSGFDGTKINDMTHTSAKYTFARAVQDLGISAKDARGKLGPIVEELKKHGFADAKAVGE